MFETLQSAPEIRQPFCLDKLIIGMLVVSGSCAKTVIKIQVQYVDAIKVLHVVTKNVYICSTDSCLKSFLVSYLLYVSIQTEE